MAGPVVSVIVANYNGAPYLDAALTSILRQSLADLEVIVVDDASTDDSVARLRAAAARDPRIRLFTRQTSGGPGAARNAALDAARGEWLAVVDSDDLIHPERLAALVAKARADSADIVVDDLLIFSETGPNPPRPLFHGRLAKAPQWIDLAWLVRSNRLFGAEPALGFTKPLIRRAALEQAGLRYDETMPVAEDYDLLARLLLAGLRMRAYPDLTYFYRKHSSSISHRLDLWRLEAMQANAARFRAAAGGDPAVAAAQDLRDASLDDAVAFTRLITALKARRPLQALNIALARPGGALLLRTTLADKVAGWLRARRPERPIPDVLVLSRQRVVGPTNGSSTYLLSLCRALKGAGRELDFLGPSPLTFGSWLVLPLKREMGLFRSIRLRGGVRVGDKILALSPQVLGRTLASVADAVLLKLKLIRTRLVKPAPYAIGAPPTRADLLYIARHGRGARAILADYAFTAPLAPYALTPQAPVLVVMHDLFSARGAFFEKAGAQDSVAVLDEATEMALLAQADAVLAIQEAEAEHIRARLPRQVVITAPLAVEPVAEAQPGVDGKLLLVASNTAPNVVGLQWFLDGAWPMIRAARPDAELLVAGNVSRAFPQTPPGVRMLGPVGDLEPLYTQAGVVISPLTAGSGLKIKLIEGLGRGKAMVGTPVTLQGVETLVEGALSVAETPEAFGRAVVALLDDTAARAALGQAALERVSRWFSPEACYGEMLSFVREGGRVG